MTAEHTRDAMVTRTVELVEQRLWSIIQGVGGRNVGSNEEELWFEPAATLGLQVRLSSDRDAPSYDRSANFAISYGSQSSDSPRFRDVLARIKLADSAPIEGAGPAFRAAVQAIARRTAPSFPDNTEADRARARQNVRFLDLCAQLVGHAGEELTALHFGFWPVEGNAPAHDYDPFMAYSHHLLSHVPEAVERVLDVGCGLGVNAKLLSQRGKRVMAVSPVPHHCAAIDRARLPNVDVRCARFEDLPREAPHDLLLFSESMNHFPLDDGFLAHCRSLLRACGFILLADDLSRERIRFIETQRIFRPLRVLDITANVAPTARWWAMHMRPFAAYHEALMATLESKQPGLASRVQQALDAVEHRDLRALLSGQLSPPPLKGRYMIYLLQRD